MRVIICGANGTMGSLLQQRLTGQIVGLVSLNGENGICRSLDQLGDTAADMIMDFSHHSAITDILNYAEKNGCATVIGTTGHTEEEKARIYAAATTLPIFYSGNLSLGIAVLCRLAKEAAAAFPDGDIEILEIHHNRKVDAPSGTAHMLFHALQEVRPHASARCGRSGEGKRTKNEIGISSLRMGNVVAVHEVHICSPSQTLTLRHEAHDRSMFADGAVEAARYICGKPPGLYTMAHLIQRK